MSQEQMFCYQCEQTYQGKGCTIAGVCGKTLEVATLQDLLVYRLRGLSQASIDARKAGIEDEAADIFTCEALFATLTNVNFNPDNIIAYIRKAAEMRDELKWKTTAAGGHIRHSGAIASIPETTKEGLVAQGKLVGIKSTPR